MLLHSVKVSLHGSNIQVAHTQIVAGQSQPIFVTGSTGCVTPSPLSELCYADAL
jgi:hypothetical protein